MTPRGCSVLVDTGTIELYRRATVGFLSTNSNIVPAKNTNIYVLHWHCVHAHAATRSPYWSRRVDRTTSFPLGHGLRVSELDSGDIRSWALRCLSARRADGWCYFKTHMTAEQRRRKLLETCSTDDACTNSSSL